MQLRNVNTSLGVMNIVGNVLIFVPIGALTLWALSMRWWTAAACGAEMSLLVELGQLTLGRSADIDDVLLNSCGAIIGAVAAAFATSLVTRGVAASARRRQTAFSTGPVR